MKADSHCQKAGAEKTRINDVGLEQQKAHKEKFGNLRDVFNK